MLFFLSLEYDIVVCNYFNMICNDFLHLELSGQSLYQSQEEKWQV